MARMTLSLPDTLQDWVENEARAERFGTAETYVESLLERERYRKDAVSALNALIAEGLESGISNRSMDEVLAEARRRAMRPNDADL